MSEGIKISATDAQAATLHLVKEIWAQNMVIAEMLNRLLAGATGEDERRQWAAFESVYKKRIEEINTYLAAEFGTLDLSELMKG